MTQENDTLINKISDSLTAEEIKITEAIDITKNVDEIITDLKKDDLISFEITESTDDKENN